MSIVLRIGAVRGNAYGADHLVSSQDATNSDSDVLDIPASEELCHRPAQTYPGCFGLPYQDHNYGAPPPLSPTPPKSPPAPPAKVNGVVELEEEAKVPVVSQEEEVVEDSVTRCICGFLHDDGYMICCDKCSVWQHIDCMGVDRNNIPENYCCELCEPRKLDFERAKMIQLQKREEIDTSATDTDPEEPANALASLGKKQVPAKPKAAKQRRVSKAGAREKGLLKSAKLAKSGQYKRDKKLKLTKKEKENMKEASRKQKLLKGGLARQKKLKKKLSSSLYQNKAEQWNNPYGLWNNYEEAKENEYGPEILELLSQAKSNGIHSPHSIGVFPEELLVRLYQVSDVKKNRKGLEATDLIVPGRAVIEFKGKVMLSGHQHNATVNQAQPYVLFYSKFEGLDLCIDASAYGGDARFIRRSCTPNSEMCHIIDNGNLHFIVQAKKEIAKGSEITIPFDFSYQDCATSVECACGRATCPVAKFWKKIKLSQKPNEKPKRKRHVSGESHVRRNSQSKGSPLKAAVGSKSPVKSSPVKSPASVPLPLSLGDATIPHETAAAAEGPQSFPVVKPAPVARRSSRAASDTKEERELKCSKTGGTSGKENPTKAALVQSHSSSVDSQGGDPAATQAASESEADSSSECPKKLTREERKMEAIMKAFEKMAKREERRKEALARLDKKHDVKKEEPADAVHLSPAYTGTSLESGCEHVIEQQPAAAAATASSSQDLEGKVVVKIEDPGPVVESPAKSQRRRPRRQRRRSRVQSMSAAEPLQSVTTPHAVAHMSSAPDGLHMSGEDSRDEMCGYHLPSLPATLAPLPDLTQNVGLESAASYMFHKTKKHLYNEWSVSRGPDGRNGSRLDPLEVHIGQEEFVPYTPSPRNAIEHWQRRNSTSAGCSSRATDPSVGNAKKRWLRQAMHETGPSGAESGSSSPVHAGSCSPNHFSSSLPSPGGSPPADFVTPLKKRRLARESLSQDQAPLSTPSTPSPSLTPAAPPDFTVSVSPSSATATVTTAMLCSTDTQEGGSESSAVGTSARQAERKAEIGTRHLGHGESCVSETEAVPAADVDLVSQSSSQQHHQQEELSMDGLSSSVGDRTVQLVSAGSSATVQAVSSADSGEVCDSLAGVSDNVQTSRVATSQVPSNEASAMEVSDVDSSGAAFDADLNARHETSENVGVGSTDNEVSRPCIHSADAGLPHRTGVVSDQDRVVECSSASADVSRMLPEEGGVSEGSHQAQESMEVEEFGNEASGSACEGSQEPERPPVRQPLVECQVNSSQDVSWSVGLAARTGSPSQGEAESNVSSESVGRTQPEQGSSADRERTGVSSAQDSLPVSSFMRDSDAAASSDTECGPSSSTQVTNRCQLVGNTCGEDMVCNSSDTSAPCSAVPVPEEGNVDSTSQSNGRNTVRRSVTLHSSADNCHLAEDSEASSFCDSNSERGDYPATDEGQGVSSSGPADSQSTEVLDSGQVCVVSSVHSSVSSCTPSVSSSPFNSARISDSPVSGREVCSVSAGSSPSVVTTENLDIVVSGHPTSSASPSGSSTSMNAVDSASQDNMAPLVNSATSLSTDRSEADVVGTSHCVSGTSQRLHGSPEANNLWGSLRLSDRVDGNTQPVSSLSLPTQGMGENEAVNGYQAGSISSASSEDSFGATPSTSVSSSEAQAAQRPAPVTKRKVSLFEYRKRLKGKTASSGGPSSPKSTTSDNGYSSRRSILDSSITLAPLPLFEPITISSERRESREKEKEKREKPMSLSDRLRIEFGLEDSEEEERVNNAESITQSSPDIPPPPPLPPNGMLSGVGVGPRSLSASSGPRARPTDDESESSQSSTSGFSTGNAATSSMASAGLVNSVPVGLNHAAAAPPPHGHAGLQAGFAWPSKLQAANQGMVGAGVASQPPLTTPAATFSPGSAQQPSHLLQGPGGSHLPNGSHTQPAAAAFSTGPAYLSPQGHQPFRNGAKQQPPPPPPPPPNTAYPPYIAQSRTHPPPPHPQTSQAASSSHLTTRHGRSASFSHRSLLLGAGPGATGSRSRQVSEDHSSPTRPSSRHHFEYSHSPAKQKGHFSNHSGSDRKRR